MTASPLRGRSDLIQDLPSGQPFQGVHLAAQAMRRQLDTMSGQIVADLARDSRVLTPLDLRGDKIACVGIGGSPREPEQLGNPEAQQSIPANSDAERCLLIVLKPSLDRLFP